MIPITDLWQDIENPETVVMKFEGGPLDGETRKATPKKVLDQDVSIVLKDKSVYRYNGNNTFVYAGVAPAPAPPPPKPSLKFRIAARFINWILGD